MPSAAVISATRTLLVGIGLGIGSASPAAKAGAAVSATAADTDEASASRVARRMCAPRGWVGEWSGLARSTSAHTVPRVRTQRCGARSEEHTSELQSRQYLVCRLL